MKITIGTTDAYTLTKNMETKKWLESKSLNTFRNFQKYILIYIFCQNMFKEIHFSKRIEMSFHWQAVSFRRCKARLHQHDEQTSRSFDLQSLCKVDKDAKCY